MSDENAFTFTATAPIYSLTPGVDQSDIKNQLSARTGQLHALLALIGGEGRERFEQMSGDIRDNYLWACDMIAKECNELSQRL
jgi:predicted metal-dependent enzyme (double-stranded beta helix superfamily)